MLTMQDLRSLYPDIMKADTDVLYIFERLVLLGGSKDEVTVMMREASDLLRSVRTKVLRRLEESDESSI